MAATMKAWPVVALPHLEVKLGQIYASRLAVSLLNRLDRRVAAG
jgi:hypothetical protein